MAYKIDTKIRTFLTETSIVLVQGAMGNGKTTYLKRNFSEYAYVSFQELKFKNLFASDPQRFFNLFTQKTVFDDIEEVEDFLIKMCTYSLTKFQKGFSIVCSNILIDEDFELVKKVNFYPLSFSELKSKNKLEINIEKTCLNKNPDLNFKKHLQTLLKSKVSKITHIQNEKKFVQLIFELAKIIDKPLNINLLAQKIKSTQPTVDAWLQVLRKIGLIVFLEPLQETFGKRITKSPKIYFVNTSLVCEILKLKSSLELVLNEHFASIYINLIIIELLKKNEFEIKPKNVFYWKESNGHELKFIQQNPTSYDVFELTISQEVQKLHYKELDFFDHISEGLVLSKTLIYGGQNSLPNNEVSLLSWRNI